MRNEVLVRNSDFDWKVQWQWREKVRKKSRTRSRDISRHFLDCEFDHVTFHLENQTSILALSLALDVDCQWRLALKPKKCLGKFKAWLYWENPTLLQATDGDVWPRTRYRHLVRGKDRSIIWLFIFVRFVDWARLITFNARFDWFFRSDWLFVWLTMWLIYGIIRKRMFHFI